LRVITATIFTLFLLLGTMGIVGAQSSDLTNPFGGDSDLRPIVSSNEQVRNIFSNIVRWLYTLFFILAVLFILLAAYNYIQGGTDENKLKTAKNQLKYAVISIAIALLATGFSVVIKEFLGRAVN